MILRAITEVESANDCPSSQAFFDGVGIFKKLGHPIENYSLKGPCSAVTKEQLPCLWLWNFADSVVGTAVGFVLSFLGKLLWYLKKKYYKNVELVESLEMREL